MMKYSFHFLRSSGACSITSRSSSRSSCGADPPLRASLTGSSQNADVRGPAPPTMYLYYSPLFSPPSEFSLRTSVPPAAVAGQVRRVLDDVLRDVPVKKVIRR